MQPNIKIDLFMVAPDQAPEEGRLRDQPAHFHQAQAASAPGSAASLLLPSCGGGMEQIGRRNSLYEAVVRLLDSGRCFQPDCCSSYRAGQL